LAADHADLLTTTGPPITRITDYVWPRITRISCALAGIAGVVSCCIDPTLK
jgi:hypothetical protein